MRKYFFKDEEVYLNKPFKCEVKNPKFSFNFHTDCLDPIMVNILISEGILTFRDTEDYQRITFADCVEYIAKKNHWTIDKTVSFLSKIQNTCNASALVMVAKAAAVLMDKKHGGHIAEAPEIWAVSTVDWQVHKMNKETIKDYLNFAAFRSKEEAMVALQILKQLDDIRE